MYIAGEGGCDIIVADGCTKNQVDVLCAQVCARHRFFGGGYGNVGQRLFHTDVPLLNTGAGVYPFIGGIYKAAQLRIGQDSLGHGAAR
ncbi:hypothetical protein SDC9_95006 [bioreactor metagenome]|uniref:Uncharacterized protein n=1 Tax=bioreactor metagenome TaxID=1076179 RepID=A0A645A5C5_9ZZZZ